MDPSASHGPVEPRHAATVMVVRDGPGGIETLLLRRNPDVEFVGGAHVFPGGAVDDPDRDLAAVGALDPGRDDGAASRELGLAEGGLAFWAAAVRECFEEAGLLLAAHGDEPAASPAEVADARRAVDQGRRRFVDVCVDLGLRPTFEHIHYLGHWITPEGGPRRYDTRFFVAPAPQGQVASPDDHEAVASTWLRPAEALDHCRSGELELILPTRRSLEVAADFTTADAFLGALTRVPTDATGARCTVDEAVGPGRLVALGASPVGQPPSRSGALVP